MFRIFCVICLVLPVILNAKEFDQSTEDLNSQKKSKSDSYISTPPSSSVLKKGIENLKKEINTLENIKAQKVFDHLVIQKKEVTDKNLLEIYHSILSFLRIQSNMLPEEQLRKKLNSLINCLNWLYSNRTDEKFVDKVTYLGQLLKQEFFIHLNHQKMSVCLDIVHHLKDVVQYSNLGNDLTPEDGSDYFSSDFFLQNEIQTAQQIYSQVIELENIAKNFSKYTEALGKEQLTWNIKNANDFSNKLKSTYLVIGSKSIIISRNIRKHLKNLTAASIVKLIEKRNSLPTA